MPGLEDAVASVVDTAGIAVITGGASGIGLATAAQLVHCGMAVAILDVSAEELAAASGALRAAAPGGHGQVLATRCDVTSSASCEAAKQEVAASFPDKHVTFLFCNAGISGVAKGIIKASADSWTPVFAVNVFGVANTIKAFVPGIIAAGPPPTGKKAIVLCTSSVVGLVNSSLGPYSVSKMACTALTEQFSLELEAMGPKAAHISPHLLAPSAVSTSFFNARGADGVKSMGDAFKDGIAKLGSLSTEGVVGGIFRGLSEGRFYIILDHELDIPTPEQIAARMEDQVSGRRPRQGEQIGVFLKPEQLEQRREVLAQRRPSRL